MNTLPYDELFVHLLVALKLLFLTAHITFPILLFLLFHRYWVQYLQAKVVDGLDPVLLEIKLPKEVRKSPLAMELVFTQMYQKANMTFLQTYWEGKIVPYYSLEIVSIGGNLHFYIWTPKKQKNIIEAQLYAQYPTAEIYEVPDYAVNVRHDLSKMTMWGCHWKLKKPDPFPIKTYVDFELDRNATEKDQETVVDPMSTMIEYLGSLKPGEQGWVQILIRAHRDYGIGSGDLKAKPDWKKDVEKEIEAIQEKYKPQKEKDSEGRVMLIPGPQMTEADKNSLKSLHRSLEKYAFDAVIRGAYIADLDAADYSNIPGLIGCVRQYDDNTSNGFGLDWFTDFDNPWEDFKRMRRTGREKMFLDAYKQRSFYYGKYAHIPVKNFVLTTEELATLFHLPGGVITTPTIERIGSRKAQPPSNLPV